jgi:hypothetical protein
VTDSKPTKDRIVSNLFTGLCWLIACLLLLRRASHPVRTTVKSIWTRGFLFTKAAVYYPLVLVTVQSSQPATGAVATTQKKEKEAVLVSKIAPTPNVDDRLLIFSHLDRSSAAAAIAHKLPPSSWKQWGGGSF